MMYPQEKVSDVSNRIIVTRHPTLVKYMIELGLADENTPVVPFAKEDDVRGKDVLGVLPLHLSRLARTITAIPLHLPPDLRGKELTLAQVREYAGQPIEYSIQITGESDDKQ